LSNQIIEFLGPIPRVPKGTMKTLLAQTDSINLTPKLNFNLKFR